VNVVQVLGGCRGGVVEVLVWPLGVEPMGPFQGLDLDVVDIAPRPRVGGSARSARMCSSIAQPITRREWASMTVARWSHPSQVRR
jgi:hypothetical protein